MGMTGGDGDWWDRDRLKRAIPHIVQDGRYPVEGACAQPRAGMARHDAVGWGYARAAEALGVDIVQNCRVTGFAHAPGAVAGVETSRRPIAAQKVGLAVAGSSSLLAKLAGPVRLPIETQEPQAYVSEPLKPYLDCVPVWRLGDTIFCMSQSDEGGLMFGGEPDRYPGKAQTGALSRGCEVVASAQVLLPSVSRIRLPRHWAGVMDMVMHWSLFFCRMCVDGLYMNAGWRYGGFKATPASGWRFAYTIAHDAPQALNAGFTLDRFATGRTLDKNGGGPVPTHH